MGPVGTRSQDGAGRRQGVRVAVELPVSPVGVPQTREGDGPSESEEPVGVSVARCHLPVDFPVAYPKPQARRRVRRTPRRGEWVRGAGGPGRVGLGGPGLTTSAYGGSVRSPRSSSVSSKTGGVSVPPDPLSPPDSFLPSPSCHSEGEVPSLVGGRRDGRRCSYGASFRRFLRSGSL